jgi:predicted ATP-dependent protease
MDQKGNVQAIGGVNEKIEGFYDICKARGLTGDQGVLIPASNVKHLMLRQDVIDSVASGQFYIYPVEHVDQGIELLTGMPAGEADVADNYPEDTFNARVQARLDELAQKAKEQREEEKEKDS